MDLEDSSVTKIYDYEVPKDLTGDAFVVCIYCLNEYRATNIYKHKCEKRMENKDPGSKFFLKACRSVVPDANLFASKVLREKVLGYMRRDETYQVVIHDEFLTKFGNHLIEFYHKVQDPPMVSRKLRILASLLVLVREYDEKVIGFADVLQSKVMPAVKKVLKNMIKYHVAAGIVLKPSSTAELTGILKKAVKCHENCCIEK